MSLQNILTADGKTVMVNVVDNGDRKFPLTDWHDPAKHPPTFGVSSAYVPQEYPKAIYTSFSNSITVNSKEEEEEAIKRGGSTSYNDFPAPVELAEMGTVESLHRQVAALQALISQQASERTAKSVAFKEEEKKKGPMAPGPDK